ncbi:hypothetical protein Vretimale_10640, partial [Volvox reticuliferus]
ASDAASYIMTVHEPRDGVGSRGAAAAVTGPATPPQREVSGGATASTAAVEAAAAICHPRHVWYVTSHDLEFFRLRAERDVIVHGAGPWSHIMDRDVPGSFLYSAWRRTLPNGLTEYRSITILPDCSPLEYVDFSFDDNARCRWEGFMVSAELLEAGNQRQRQQVVR